MGKKDGRRRSRPAPGSEQQRPPGHPLQPSEQPSPKGKQVLIIVVGVAAILAMLAPLFLLNNPRQVTGRSLSYVLAAIDQGHIDGNPIKWIEVDDNSRAVILTVPEVGEIAAHYPDYYAGDLIARLEASGIPFETEPVASPSIWSTLALSVLPVLLLIGFLVFFLRRSGLGGAGMRAFTTAQAQVGGVPAVRFTDVVGCDEAVEELSEVVAFLHEPTRFTAAGARIPRGFLLVGPPGTGKTLLARAVAGEAGVPFYSAAGSDFAEMFVGVGASRVRDLFAKAKKTGGIVFLDEIDSVGRVRHGAASNGSSEERESTLNALLVEMDGFGQGDNVIVMAATNRPDILDPALLRAGRFDRQITVAPPDRRGRTHLLRLYTEDRKLAADVDVVMLARRTPGLTGADIANVVNQAALEAARNNRDEILARDFDEALATVMMGRARRSAVVSDRDRRITAWHEAGHAVTALVLPDAADPLQVTIVPRGPAGGVTWMGGDDNSFLTRSQARARLAVSLAGRAAEELLLDGDFTQGASGDLATATSLATRMVTEWGMSGVGLVALGPEHAEPGLVRREIDSLLGAALDTARTLLAGHRALLEAVVGELLDEETIDLDRLEALRAAVDPAPAA